MFHKSNFGKFGKDLPSDLRGYVPEEGDEYENFHWDAKVNWNKESWERFVEKAKTKTKRAKESLKKWRQSQD